MSVDKKAFGISDSLVNAVTEALKGGQVKLDKNHNGKLDSQDFKMLRKEELKGGQVKLDKNHNGKLDKQDFKMLRKEEVVDEGNPANKAKKNAAAAAVGAKNRDSQYLSRMNPAVADKIRGREKMSGKDRQQHEEVEQVDELSTDTYHKAAHKAAKRAMTDVQGRSGPIFKKYAGMANKFRDKGMSQEKKEKAMKEEVEILESSQEIAKKYKDYVTGGGSTQTASRYKSHVNMLSKKTGQHPDAINKEVRKHVKAMKEETVSEVSDAAKKVLGAVAKKSGGKVPFTSTTYKDGKRVVTRGHNDEKGNRVVTSVKNEEVEHIEEAGNAVAKQIAAKKDTFKKQLQQKIAAKQMNVMQAKANKRLSNIHASNDKCSCQEGKGKSMTCEVHGDKANGIKGGKEQIIVNPPMREAAELPKKVITKGHEIAKSLIKHKSKVDNPYAVGMAAAKKSAKIKAYRADREKHGED